MRFGILLLLLLSAVSRADADANADSDIRDLLATQVDGWNQGKIEAFMLPYADNCTFMGKEIVRSREKWAATSA